MSWKNQLTKTPYLILFIFLAAIGIGTASAVMTITLAGDVIIEGNTQMDNNLNVDGIITGNTINELNQDILDIQNSMFFMDIVVTNFGDHDISVLLNNGDNTFVPKIDTAVLDDPFGVAIGDLNNDGNQDVVVANRGNDENRISVLLGNGDGTFAKTDIVTGEFPVDVAIADINNDGNQDVVVSNGAVDNDISVLLGEGDGTFLPKIDTDVGTDPRGIAIGDLNNDGVKDIVVANEFVDDPEQIAKIAVLLGNGDGTFDRTDIQIGEFLIDVAIGDINNDGNQDVVVTSSGDVNFIAHVLFGEGDGTFGGIQDKDLESGPRGVAFGDLDNDGFGDFVVATQGVTRVWIYYGAQDSQLIAVTPEVGKSPTGVAIGDLNNDGFQDIVVTNSGDDDEDLLYQVSILLGNGVRSGDAWTIIDVPVGVDPYGVAIGNLGGPTPLD